MEILQVVYWYKHIKLRINLWLYMNFDWNCCVYFLYSLLIICFKICSQVNKNLFTQFYDLCCLWFRICNSYYTYELLYEKAEAFLSILKALFSSDFLYQMRIDSRDKRNTASDWPQSLANWHLFTHWLVEESKGGKRTLFVYIDPGFESTLKLFWNLFA